MAHANFYIKCVFMYVYVVYRIFLTVRFGTPKWIFFFKVDFKRPFINTNFSQLQYVSIQVKYTGGYWIVWDKWFSKNVEVEDRNNLQLCHRFLFCKTQSRETVME